MKTEPWSTPSLPQSKSRITGAEGEYRVFTVAVVGEIAIRATDDHRRDFDRAAYVMSEFGAMGLVQDQCEGTDCDGYVDLPADLLGAEEGGTIMHVTPFVLCEGAFASSDEHRQALRYMRLIAEGLSHPVQSESPVLESESLPSVSLGTE